MHTPQATQQDTRVRMVALENLRAMCDRISGFCHRFTVTKVSLSRVHVTYSNPDEYGHESPVTAVYPCYPSSGAGDTDNPRVVLDALRYLGCPENGPDSEAWQAFTQLTDCPTLWRESWAGPWSSHAEIRKAQHNYRESPDTCTVCDLPKGEI